MATFEPPPTVDNQMLLPHELRDAWAVCPWRSIAATWLHGLVCGLGIAGSVYGFACGDNMWKGAAAGALVILVGVNALPWRRRADAALKSWWASKAT